MITSWSIGHCQSKDYDKKTDSLESILKNSSLDTNRVNILASLFNQYRRSDFLKAIQIADEELETSAKLHFLAGEAKACRHLGISYYGIGDKNQAVFFFIEAMKRYEKLKMSYYVAACYNNIGLVYMDERNYSEASNYFSKAFDIWSKLKKAEEGIAIVLNNMADLYVLQGKDSLALVYNLSALKIAKQADINVGATWYSLAKMYMKMKDNRTARSYLDSACIIASKKNDKQVELNVQLAYSKIYSGEKKYEQALIAAQKGSALALQAGNQSSLVETLALLADIHASKGDFHSAYTFQRNVNELQDSLHKKNNNIRIEQMVYAHELEKKNLQSQALLKDKELSAAQITIYEATIQRQYAWGAFIGIVLLAFATLSLFYFRSYRRKQHDLHLLGMKNQEIELQNEEIRLGNQEINAQRESLAKLNAEQNKLFSIIAHDLRSPLNNVKSVVMLFQNSLITGQRTEQLLHRLLNALSHTSAFLDNLLHWARSQMKGCEVLKQAFDVGEIICENINLLREQADAKPVAIQNNVTGSYRVMADVEMINVVVRNLISNAIKFSRPNDTVSVSATSKDGYVMISIADRGIGMSDEVQKKIMTNHDFYSTPGTQDEKGTGIGINLCVDFINKNNGKLDVWSKPDEGSIFTFSIPCDELKNFKQPQTQVPA